MNSFTIKGKLDVVLSDKSGNVKETRHVDNLIVTTGSWLIADIFATADATRGTYGARPCAMAVGTHSKDGSRWIEGTTIHVPTAASEIHPATSDDQRLYWEIDRCTGTSGNFTLVHTPISVTGTTPAGSNELEYTGVFKATETGCGYINEAGIFNNEAAVVHTSPDPTNIGIQSGIMINRATFLPVYKEPEDILTIIWKITIQPKTAS